MDDFTVVGLTLSLKPQMFSCSFVRVVVLKNTSRKQTEMPPSRAARLFVLFRAIIPLYFGVPVAVAVMLAQTP